ncbi:hypothetical protein TW95_gp1095 [Pandoravirus inopinatum]|uniref:Uncharacterized protein n=1 Tax=Pandoravirus inopinatum TaxID=1605721 RepID=A0A0B5J2N6_9VIRU|nr:hypothetical protein TW95_gp1095 [Pandoravirus inopinatum]AJF97829.1 hypothetical protein [Pandoravirus inopinatum]
MCFRCGPYGSTGRGQPLAADQRRTGGGAGGADARGSRSRTGSGWAEVRRAPPVACLVVRRAKSQDWAPGHAYSEPYARGRRCRSVRLAGGRGRAPWRRRGGGGFFALLTTFSARSAVLDWWRTAACVGRA